jgi:hypothetical protein
MRLTLATSALLAFPTVSSSEFQNHEVITKRAKSAGQLRMLKNTLFYNKNRYAAQRGNPAGNASNRQAFSMPRHTGVLKNKNKDENRRTLQAGADCDPTAALVDVDTGILQFGTSDLICVSDDASMGGVCTSFTDYADDLSDALIDGLAGFIFAALCGGLGDCDCQEFDLTAGAGIIKCTSAMCEDESCNLCASREQTLVLEGNTTIKSSVCGKVFEPYEQSYCYNVMYDTEDRSASTCEINIGGTPCTSCVYDTTKCSTFDCTNTVDEAQAGNMCTDTPLPIQKEIDTIVNDANFNPAPAAATCEDVLGRGSSAAAGAAGSLLLVASTFASMVVVGYLIV